MICFFSLQYFINVIKFSSGHWSICWEIRHYFYSFMFYAVYCFLWLLARCPVSVLFLWLSMMYLGIVLFEFIPLWLDQASEIHREIFSQIWEIYYHYFFSYFWSIFIYFFSVTPFSCVLHWLGLSDSHWKVIIFCSTLFSVIQVGL